MLRLLAPIMPYVTEEVWSWWQEGSIHRAAWPTAAEVAVDGDRRCWVTWPRRWSQIRGAKSQAKVSMRTEVTAATFLGPADSLDRLRAVEADLRAVGRLTGELGWTQTDGPITVQVELAPTT